MIKPNKQLGQHWLRDDQTLQAICNEAKLNKEDFVLEIGPGLGTLTKYLAESAGEVIAVEFDSDLASNLQDSMLPSNVTVVNDDILKFNLTELPAGYKVVANLPYYITSKIVRLLLESPNPPSLAVLLVQKEVAERMAAAPGDMSVLAVSCQLYSNVSLGPIVPAELFEPAPKVDSQVVVLNLRTEPLFKDVDSKLLFRVVKAGFSEKRKTMRNSIAGGLGLTKDQAEGLLKRAGIDPGARAEQLSLQDWYSLAKSVKA